MPSAAAPTRLTARMTGRIGPRPPPELDPVRVLNTDEAAEGEDPPFELDELAARTVAE